MPTNDNEFLLWVTHDLPVFFALITFSFTAQDETQFYQRKKYGWERMEGRGWLESNVLAWGHSDIS